MSHVRTTQFGFEYGAATIERAWSNEEKGWVVMLLKTPKFPEGIQLYVTKSGMVRIDGQKWVRR